MPANGRHTLTKGPLPPRVYWVRRLALLSVVLVVVLIAVKLIGRGDDPAPTTEQKSAAATSSATLTPSAVPTTAPKPKKTKKPAPVLPTPTGECDATDVIVMPSVGKSEGGSNIEFTLNLRSQSSPACTFTVSPDTITVSITSGSDDIWSSQQCPAVIPRQDVTVYLGYEAKVPFTWNARRSDDTCSKATAWALPGTYHVAAAAFGGPPTDVRFEVTPAKTVTVTKTITPTPTATASGAIEPNG